MTVWNLKGCPRCGGDTFIDRDIDGWYESCLMCGYAGDAPRVARVTAKATVEAEKLEEEATGVSRRSGVTAF